MSKTNKYNTFGMGVIATAIASAVFAVSLAHFDDRVKVNEKILIDFCTFTDGITPRDQVTRKFDYVYDEICGFKYKKDENND